MYNMSTNSTLKVQSDSCDDVNSGETKTKKSDE